MNYFKSLRLAVEWEIISAAITLLVTYWITHNMYFSVQIWVITFFIKTALLTVWLKNIATK